MRTRSTDSVDLRQAAVRASHESYILRRIVHVKELVQVRELHEADCVHIRRIVGGS